MNWISVEEMLLIHARVIDTTGGAHGLVNPRAIESAIHRPFTAFDRAELFPTMLKKVAALIHSVIAFHPSVDGNKRTVLVAADVILRLSGFRMTPTFDIEQFFWSIARGAQDVLQIAAWLETHTGEFGSNSGDSK